MSIRTTLKNALYRSVTATVGDRDGMVVLPVLSGPARGLRLELDLIHRQEAYFWGKYDTEILRQLAPLIGKGWRIWDCGTYLGFYTCFFARAVGPEGLVVAIEPDPSNLDRTLRNTARNGLTNVQAANVAIGPPAGEIELVVSLDSNSHLPGYYVGDRAQSTAWKERDRTLRRIKVRCVSLDQALLDERLPTPDLIKIDIEGAELHAMDHLDRMVREVRPVIVLELHNPDCDEAARRFAERTSYQLFSAMTGRPVSGADVQGTLICVPPGGRLRPQA